MSYLLLIDNDPGALVTLVRQSCPAPGLRVEAARTGAAGIAAALADPPDVIVLNRRLPDQCGLAVYRQVRDRLGAVPVVFVTARWGADAAIEAMREGAYDCLPKPPDPDHLARVLGEALGIARRLRAPSAAATAVPAAETAGQLLGTCPAMLRVYKAIGLVAAQSFPVLITGESGTGKELVARAIHQHSARADRTFLALNTAAIPEALLESELFGHEKGAFTGANGKRVGKFQHCDGGTLFLDEIGDMPLGSQAKLLRVLQEQAFEPVGGNETIRTDVRLIAATHRDLAARAVAGEFRPDLYYRLGVFPIHLPPLRERSEDLPVLMEYYLRRFSRELGREVREAAPEVLDRFRKYTWPGNVRELQSVLKQALLRGTGTVLLSSFLPDSFGGTADGPPAARRPGPALDAFLRECLQPDSRDLYAEAHRQVDRLLLPRVLEYTGGSQYKAASMLGIARQTLRLKLREQGIRSRVEIGSYEEEYS